jgi:hypothetical protein
VRDPGGYVVVPEVEVLPADDPADSVRLTWVAPGDNGDTGTATRYELRVSEQPIDAGNFAAARLLPAPAPAAAGRPQSVRVGGPRRGHRVPLRAPWPSTTPATAAP